MDDSGVPRVRLESDAKSLKVRALALLLPRYRRIRSTLGVDEELRILLGSMVLTPDRRLFYVRSSKAAGSAIVHLLHRYATEGEVGADTWRAEGGLLQGYPHWRDYLDVLDNHGAFVFGFVRHPTERFMSAFRDFWLLRRNSWRYRHARPMRRFGYDPAQPPERNLDVFIDYVARSLAVSPLYADRHWRKQVHNLAYGRIDYDLIGRTERLESDMRKVLESAGIPAGDLLSILTRRDNNTDSAPPLDPTPAQRRKIEALYADDFETFGY